MQNDDNHEFDLAIVGMAGRFPGAASVSDFWSNLSNGVESIRTFSQDELLDSGTTQATLSQAGFVPRAPVLDNAARFDASFFDMSPADAALLDPQQRQLLEVAWQAIEDAGYDITQLEDRVGVFASTAMNTYLLSTGLAETFNENYLSVLLASDKDFQATRIAFKLGLTGPAMSVQTACSSSLVAMHLASQSLLGNECDMALVGAAAIRTPLATGHIAESGSVFSPDGHCRPFDKNANGTIFGSGVCVLAIKRYAKAIEDKDNILALVKGSAINNDGNSKSDFTAPSITQQAAAISEAMGIAGVYPEDISYIEAHGTGTYLGDPIEVEALSRAFGANHEAQTCRIGSVKSNIGHLDAAAGMASVAKVVLALQHKQIPPTINFTEPNPEIDFSQSPFRVVSELEPWTVAPGSARTAGITSLGMGGTNAHVILQEYVATSNSDDLPVVDQQIKINSDQILPISAKTKTALETKLSELSSHLKQTTQSLSDIAFTLQHGRSEMRHRASIVASNVEDAAALIDNANLHQLGYREAQEQQPLTLLFPGQGAQHIGMGESLYDSEPIYRNTIDSIAEHFLTLGASHDIRELMYQSLDAQNSNKDGLIHQTINTQPCIFASQLAYADLLQAWGVVPDALLGHSIGEYAAAVTAGILSKADATLLVFERAKAMQSATQGSMIAVALSQAKTQEFLEAQEQAVSSLEICVVNSIDSTVVGGPTQATEQLQLLLTQQGIKHTRLKTSHAFHTSMMDSSLADFRSAVIPVTMNPPTIKMLANTTGGWLTHSQLKEGQYWIDQIRMPVLFNACLDTLFSDSNLSLLETGPGTVLSSLASSHELKNITHQVVAAAADKNSALSDHQQTLHAMGKLWSAGRNTNWAAFNTDAGHRVQLPAYPFEGENHWYKNTRKTQTSAPKLIASQSLSRADNFLDWTWTEAWLALPNRDNVKTIHNNILIAGSDLLYQAITRTVSPDTKVVFVCPSELINLVLSDAPESTILYEWSNSETAESQFTRLLKLVQQLSARDGLQKISLRVVTRGLFNPLDTHSKNPDAAIALGLVNVVGKEFQSISCSLRDLPESYSVSTNDKTFQNLLSDSDASDIQCFQHERWWHRQSAQRKLADNSLSDFQHSRCQLRDRSHVIVGAFGGIGKVLSRWIAANGGDLYLLSRSEDASKSSENSSLISELLAFGVNVHCGILPDSLESWTSYLEALSSQQNSLRYVFHLGGVTEDALIVNKTDASTSSVFNAKVLLSRTLQQATQPLDNAQLVLFSSISSWLAPVGQVDYAGANAFQQALASSTVNSPNPTISIAWPGWRDIGMMSRISDNASRQEAYDHGVSAEDALQLLAIILDYGSGAHYVSPIDLQLQDMLQKQSGTPSVAQKLDSSNQQTPTLDPNSPTASIKAVWTELLGVDDIADDDNFFALGGNSLLVVRMVNKLKQQLGVEIAPDALIDHQTPEAIANLLGLKATNVNTVSAVAKTEITTDSNASTLDEAVVSSIDIPQTSKCLKLLGGKSNSAEALFLFHSHGGLVFQYSKLAALLGTNRQVFALQSQGVDGSQPPLTRIEAMAEQYAQDIMVAAPTGSLILGGYCMGGMIAWETANRLKRAGRDIRLMFFVQSFHKDLEYPTVQLSGTYYPAHTGLIRKLQLELSKTIALINRYRADYSKPSESIRQLLKGARNRLDRRKKKDGELLLEVAGGDENLANIHRCNEEAFWHYNAPALDIPTLFFTANTQPAHIADTHTLGWREAASNVVGSVALSGTYLNGFDQFEMETISAEVERHLNSTGTIQ